MSRYWWINPCSLVLAGVLAPIVERLLEAVGNTEDLKRYVLGRVAWQMKYGAVKIAETLARTAQSWGNRSATRWLKDKGFIRYLAIISLPSLVSLGFGPNPPRTNDIGVLLDLGTQENDILNYLAKTQLEVIYPSFPANQTVSLKTTRTSH